MRRIRRFAVMAVATGALAVPGAASAATFTVNDLDDAHDAEFPGPFTDGICDASGGDGCTLRAALEEANVTAPHDDISIGVAGTITLSLGVLTASEDAEISGHQAGTIVDANDTGRVFSLSGPGVVMNDLTITGGNSSGGSGAGIFDNASTLFLNRVTVTGNTLSSAGGDTGGGIAATGSSNQLTLTDSTVSDNTITGTSGLGGGISSSGPLTLLRSTVSGNSTTLDTSGRGGGIDMNPGGNVGLIVRNSTISGNHSGGDNSGGGGGGGIFTNTNVISAAIEGSTIAGNSTLGSGGGVRLNAITAATSANTIYASNTAADAGDNCAMAMVSFSAPSNNIETGSSCSLTVGSGNQENVAPSALDLEPLADNGGFAPTQAIGLDSVALDAATGCAGLSEDQRGVTRPQGGSCDIGAHEVSYHPLSAAVAGPGTGTVSGASIACPGDCADSLPEGTEVTLTASPTGGSSFTGWSGACTGAGACVLTMDGAKSVTATFGAPPATSPQKKKCKKGRKLKKGKCVKKKRRKGK